MGEHGGTTNYENRSSDHSAALAEKLLQGWALLQEHCPQCLTPLVRNRQRKMYCVACAQWVVTQSEAAEQLARERVESESPEKGCAESSVEPIPPTETSPIPISVSEHMRENERQASPSSPSPAPSSIPILSSQITIENEREVEAIDFVEPSGPSVRTGLSLACTQEHQAPSNGGEALVIPKLDHRSKTLEQVLPNVSVILSHKLEEIGNALLASQDVNQIRLLMNALRECFNTVEALRKLQGVRKK